MRKHLHTGGLLVVLVVEDRFDVAEPPPKARQRDFAAFVVCGLAEMWSGSEAGSHLRLIDFLYHSSGLGFSIQ